MSQRFLSSTLHPGFWSPETLSQIWNSSFKTSTWWYLVSQALFLLPPNRMAPSISSVLFCIFCFVAVRINKYSRAVARSQLRLWIAMASKNLVPWLMFFTYLASPKCVRFQKEVSDFEKEQKNSNQHLCLFYQQDNRILPPNDIVTPLESRMQTTRMIESWWVLYVSKKLSLPNHALLYEKNEWKGLHSIPANNTIKELRSYSPHVAKRKDFFFRETLMRDTSNISCSRLLYLSSPYFWSQGVLVFSGAHGTPPNSYKRPG